VLKFRKLAASPIAYPYHSEMEQHFDWIWEHASISVHDYLDGEEVGTDEGINQCGGVNVYTDPRKASARIIYLLKKARERVSLQGISLHSFFRPGELREAISGLLEQGEVAVDVLLLDPDSLQAQYRSYREQLFISEDQTFEQYLEQKQHEKSELFHDTLRTIEHIRHMVEDIRRRKAGTTWEPRLTVALYASAPACFLLRIDDRMLVEQYHYGKIAPQTRSILGKDMPLFEYRRSSARLYEDESDPLRRPFDLLVNHLEYAQARARRVDVPQAAVRAPVADRPAR
jgi:hypothetical protein